MPLSVVLVICHARRNRLVKGTFTSQLEPWMRTYGVGIVLASAAIYLLRHDGLVVSMWDTTVFVLPVLDFLVTVWLMSKLAAGSSG